MKNLTLLAACLLTLTTAHSQTFGWAKQLGGTTSDVCRDIATDAAGNVYSTGSFQGTVDFDPGAGTANLTSAGASDIYISKFDAAGNYVWALGIGGTTGDEGNGIALDASGNIYLTGYFHGTVDFDPGAGVITLGNTAGADVFVLKLDASGAYQWVKQIGGNSSDHQGNRITVDASGNVYTTGKFMGALDFDPGAGTVTLGVSSSTMPQYYIQVLNASGNYVWAKFLGNSNSTAIGFDIEVNSAGEAYTCGYFESTGMDFDPSAASAVLSSQNYDVFINKWSSTGNYLWAKKIGGPNNDEALGLVLDASGNVYSTGFFYNTADFDPGAGTANLVSAGGADIYVNKLNASGTYVWAKRIGGAGDEYGYAMCIDGQGAIYSTGFFNSTADFDPGAGTANLVAVSLRDAYISKLDASGNYAWGFLLGGTGDQTGYGIAATSTGDIYTGGYFAGATDFDPTAGTTSLTPIGSNDIFIQKMNQCITPGAPTNTTPAAQLTICGGSATVLTTTGVGTIGWYDAAAGGNYLGSGNSYATPALTSTTTYYIQDSLCAAGPRTTVTVTVNPTITASLSSQTDNACFGESNGSATVTESGGTSPFSYSWSPSGGTAPTATGLTAGPYTCTITDAAGCSATQSVLITSPVALTSSLTATFISCFGGSDGSATVNVSGGTPSYTYAWAPSGGTTATATGLPIGIFTCTITDANGCTQTQSVFITQPAAIGSSQTITLCAGQTLTVGANTYTVTGIYSDILPAINGCDSTVTTDLTINAVIDISTTTGLNMITANQNGATYQWIDCLNGNAPIAGETNQTFNPTLNGDYAVIVTMNSCSDTSACTNVITGIQSNENVAFNIYPNPTNGVVTVQLVNNSSNTTIEIFNATGQLVSNERSTNSSLTIELPEENGIYLVRVTIDDASTMKKIIKEYFRKQCTPC